MGARLDDWNLSTPTTKGSAIFLLLRIKKNLELLKKLGFRCSCTIWCWLFLAWGLLGCARLWRSRMTSCWLMMPGTGCLCPIRTCCKWQERAISYTAPFIQLATRQILPTLHARNARGTTHGLPRIVRTTCPQDRGIWNQRIYSQTGKRNHF